MLVEKEIIAPGNYWYSDQSTGLPRKLEVTPEMCRYWQEQGSKMLSSGLSIPVPYEHDFGAHPMTPKEKLLNNAGEVKEYRLKDGDRLFGIVDVQDPDVKDKIGRSVRWTSPWITSFTDGNGNQWNNVIAHLALTTRPRITKQAPFESVAAALSLASEVKLDQQSTLPQGGLCLSRAGRLVKRQKDGKLRPQYPIAFSLFSGGIKFASDEDTEATGDDGGPPKKKSPPKSEGGDKPSGDKSSSEVSKKPDFGGNGESESGEGDSENPMDDTSPLGDSHGDVRMEELLCDLLNALGVYMPENVGEAQFKRALYEAAMGKIRELAAKGQTMPDQTVNKGAQNAAGNTTSPAGNTSPNPLIQQEQQPMYMSLEEIHKITDPTMRTIALSMYTENVKLRTEMEQSKKITDSLRDARLKEATAKRAQRIAMISKLSPSLKGDLEAMQAGAGFALSMGDGGSVVDPMEQTLAMLEKGLAHIPTLLTTDRSALLSHDQPTDGEMSEEAVDTLADSMARMMGCPPEKKAS